MTEAPRCPYSPSYLKAPMPISLCVCWKNLPPRTSPSAIGTVFEQLSKQGLMTFILQGPCCVCLSLFFHLQLYIRGLGEFGERWSLDGKYSQLAFRELLEVQLVFGVLVCLGIGLIVYLLAHQLLFFLLWKERKKKRKEEEQKEKREEREEWSREKGRTIIPEVKLINWLSWASKVSHGRRPFLAHQKSWPLCSGEPFLPVHSSFLLCLATVYIQPPGQSVLLNVLSLWENLVVDVCS